MAAERSTPFDRYPDLKRHLSEFERLEREHVDVSSGLLACGKGNLLYTDLVFIGILKRSLDILDAAKVLVTRWNFTAAAPLLRLQVDSLMRAAYLARVRDPEAISRALLEGKSFRSLKDEQGRKLTDARLRELARGGFPWLDKVYEETTKVVHFTGRHIFSSFVSMNETERTLESVIGAGSPQWPAVALADYLEHLTKATDAVLEIARGWGNAKQRIADGITPASKQANDGKRT